jgi:hypothetical protein
VSKFVFGDSSKETIVEIPQGQLYLVRPRSVKGYSELIFKDAAATIRRTGQEFQYQLVVQRAYEEGEEDLLAEEGGEDAALDTLAADKDEKTFLLDEGLQFRTDVRSTGEKIFAWRDLSGDVDDLWEFVCDASIKPETAALLERVALQCVYERKFRTSHEHATEDDLEALSYYEEPIPDASPVASPSSSATFPAIAPPTEELFPNTTKEKMSKKAAGKGKVPTITEDPTAAPPSVAKPEGLKTLVEGEAELHLFDFPSGTFILQDAKVFLEVTEIGNWEYWLHVVGDEREWLGQPIVDDINPVFNYEYKSFIFNHYLDDGSAYSWLLKFKDQQELEDISQGVMQALWEHLHKVRWQTAKATDHEYVMEAFQDMTMEDAPDEEEEEEETSEEEYESTNDQRSEHYDSDESEDDVETGGPKDGAENSQLAVGYKHDRSFVVRGNKIGVFKHTADNQLEFSTTISNVMTPKGKAFAPHKVMLHQQDQDMILQNSDNPNSLYRMDLETGKVVDEWKVHDDIPVKVFAPENVSLIISLHLQLEANCHTEIRSNEWRADLLRIVGQCSLPCRPSIVWQQAGRERAEAIRNQECFLCCRNYRQGSHCRGIREG